VGEFHWKESKEEMSDKFRMKKHPVLRVGNMVSAMPKYPMDVVLISIRNIIEDEERDLKAYVQMTYDELNSLRDKDDA
jgi:ribosome-associated toxin RatA of RatAB toxin-antitoxin module